jgi:ketosteroid isomerase-like protein
VATQDRNAIAIAHQAFTAQQKGVATGDWADFLAILSDDIEFRAPSHYLPNGVIHGKLAVAALLQKFAAELNLRGTLIPMKPIVFNETTVAIEFLGKGQLAGEVVTHPLVVFYEIAHDKVIRFREYVGLM